MKSFTRKACSKPKPQPIHKEIEIRYNSQNVPTSFLKIPAKESENTKPNTGHVRKQESIIAFGRSIRKEKN